MLGEYLHSVVFIVSGRTTELRHSFTTIRGFYDAYLCYLRSTPRITASAEQAVRAIPEYLFRVNLQKLRIKPGIAFVDCFIRVIDLLHAS